MDAPARAAFVVEACGDDHELCREVESLLAEGGRCNGFLSSARFESALKSIVEPGATPADMAPARRPKRPAFFWFAIAIGFAMLGLYAGTGWIVYRDVGGRHFGWESLYSREGWTVVRIYAGGPADGKIQSGDRILAFNGNERAARTGPEPFRQYLRVGSEYSMRISRGGEINEYKIRVEPWEDWRDLSRAINYILLSLVNFATGLAMALLKPRDKLARLGFLTLMLAVMRNLATPLSAHPGSPPDLEFMLNQVVAFSFPCVLAFVYHFFYKMSEASATEFVWRAIEYLLYGVSGVMAVSQLIYFAATLRGQDALITLANRGFWIVELNLVFLKTSWELYLAVAFTAICAVIVWGYRRSTDLNHRRRVRWFLAGCTLGLAPSLLLNLIGFLLSGAGYRAWTEGAAWSNLRMITDQCMVALPLSLAYGVLKHRLLDISVVVRRSLRYVLARRMLQIILILPFLGLMLPVVTHPDRTLAEILRQASSVVNLVLLALIGLSLKYRRQMRVWLERRFFREAYLQEVILRRLIASIKELDSVDQISKLACDELDSALHPKWLYLCQWKGEANELTVTTASAAGAMRMEGFSRDAILGLLKACKEARECALPSGGNAGENTSQAERVLVIPVTTSNWNEGGALVLGERKSEEPYTESDRNLLDAVVGAMSIAFENLRLKKRVDEGLREKREVLARLDRDGINLLKECPACGACFDSSDGACSVDGTALAFTLPVERTVAKRYRLMHRIGKGGMGVVFDATDLNLSRTVALKVMTSHLFGDQTALRRFEREARILAHLNHPNIVAIHDFGRLGGEGAYLVMERVGGASWRTELRTLGRIPPATAAAWIDQLLGGLNAAHQAGIVHRDLKPENVIVASVENGYLIKILDFGVAREGPQHSSSAGTLTDTGVVMGTVAYMSPEQIRGEQADARSDIFSVGIMTIEVLTGALPERGPGGTIRNAGPAALHQVLARCLADDRNQRYSCVSEMQPEFVEALRGLGGLPAVASA
jgi:eukaryotic-like serine/threonine-protein kinase